VPLQDLPAPPRTGRSPSTAASPRRVLTIAGSDSGGGAGIQADLKTFAAHGVYGLCAVTVVTAQNSVELRALAAVPPAVVAAQIEAVLDDFGADAVKIGMLGSAATVLAVAAVLRARLRRGAVTPPQPPATVQVPIVLDPVLATGDGGAALLDEGGLAALAAELLPIVTLVTPNLPELARLAEVLGAPAGAGGHGSLPGLAGASGPPAGEAARLTLARALAARGPAVLAKGGHDIGTAGDVVDLLLVPATLEGIASAAGTPGAPRDTAERAERVVRFAAPRLATRATHGTGCTLSAAVAARLAAGEELAAAVGGAIGYVRRAMAAAPCLGAGRGPLEHFCDYSMTATTLQEPYSE
jgi:hydroxymethylpyrimidine/phosphomethylpyrimidine kinase